MFATIHVVQAKAGPSSRRGRLLWYAAALIASIAVDQVESVLSHWGQ
jgi:hypothetical protein